MSQEAQPSEAPKLPLLVQFKQQLASYQHMQAQVKVQLDQITGAIIACEQMIKLHEDSAKESAMELAKQVSEDKGSLTPEENLGDIQDGKADDQTEE